MWTTARVKGTRKRRLDSKPVHQTHTKRFDEYITSKYNNTLQSIQTSKTQLINEIENLEKEWEEIKNSNSRGHIRRKLQNRKELDALKAELDILNSGKPLEEFKESVEPYTEAYERESQLSSVQKIRGACSALYIDMNKKLKPMQHVTVQKKDQSDVFRDYMEDVEQTAPEVKIMPHEICEECDDVMILESRNSVLLCPYCGTSKPYIDATSSHMAYGEEVEFTSFAYLRLNHFNERLTYAQAKESTQIPDDVIQQIMEWLYENRVRDSKQITLEMTYNAMKELKLRNYYKQNTQLWCMVTDNPPLRMSPEHEEQLRLMFKAINRLWPKYRPPDRKNFLSYNYCLYKFNELLGYDCFLPYFKLLKGDKKLAKQDEIFEQMCKDPELRWEFISSRG